MSLVAVAAAVAVVVAVVSFRAFVMSLAMEQEVDLAKVEDF